MNFFDFEYGMASLSPTLDIDIDIVIANIKTSSQKTDLM
jgi:hypothetical protein